MYAMANLPWADSMLALHRQIEQLAGAYEAIEFRLLLGSSESGRRTTEGAYFEPTVESLPRDLRVAFEVPLLIQGRMTVVQFLALLQNWRDGQPFKFDTYEFAAPEITSTLSWDQDIPAGHLFNRLINPLPPTDTEYRFHRLTGGSGANTLIRDQLNSVATSMGTTPYNLIERYMGMSWDGSTRYLTAVVPIPATMLEPQRQADGGVQVCMRYRRPFQTEDFWVRVSPEVWRSSLPKVSISGESPDSFGWYRACTRVEIPLDKPDVNVWAGRVDSTQLYDWHVLNRVETPAPPEATTRTFLTSWNRLATRRPAALLSDPTKAATGRGAANVDVAAELLLLHGLAALGYPTFYGPSPFETSGVDIMAFDVSTKTALAVSVTVTEAIADKIGKLVLLKGELSAAIGSSWRLTLVVVTIQARDSLVPARLQEASDANVIVLTGEDLKSLMDESPDLRPFEQALHRAAGIHPAASSAPG
jgi:hypothetical protein